MTHATCLDDRYSTTRLLTNNLPVIMHNSDDTYETLLRLPKGEGRRGEGGLRTKGFFKTSTPNKPLITVITVVFNGEAYIEETIKSVINQTYDNVEYIIIDGGSTDRTLDIIKKYENMIDYWISEKDSGIYDAMNKGIITTNGQWINFMNSGDQFYQTTSLQKVFSNEMNADIFYSDIQMNYQSFSKIFKARSLDHIWKGMPFSHQSMLIKASLHKKYLYDIRYKLTADFNFVLTTYLADYTFKYLSSPLSQVRTEGVSFLNRTTVYLEYSNIVQQHDSTFKTTFYFRYLIYRERVKIIIKSLLSQNIIETISKYK